MKISTKTIILIALCGVCMGLPLQPEPDNEPETTLLGKRQGAGDLQTAGTFGINVYSNPLAGGLYGASAGLLNPYSGYGMGGGLGGLGGIGSYGSSYGGGLGGAVATYGGAGLGGLGGYGSGIGGLGTYGAGIGGLGGYGGGLSTYGTGIGGLGGYGGGVGGLGGFGGGLGGLGGGLGGLGGGLGGLGGGLGGLGGGLGGLGGGLGGLGGGLGGLGGGAYSGATRKSHIKGKLIRLLQKLGSGGQIEFPTSGVGIGVGSLGGLGVAGAGGGGLDSLQAGEMIRNQLPYGMYGSVLTGNQYGFGFGNNFGVAGAGLANGLNQPSSPLLEVAKRRIFDSVGGYVASRIPNILDRLFVLREMEDDDYDD